MLIEKKNKHNIIAVNKFDNLKYLSVMAYELPHAFGAWTLVIQMQQAAKIMMKR